MCVRPEQGVCFPSCVLLRLLYGVLCKILEEINKQLPFKRIFPHQGKAFFLS